MLAKSARQSKDVIGARYKEQKMNLNSRTTFRVLGAKAGGKPEKYMVFQLSGTPNVFEVGGLSTSSSPAVRNFDRWLYFPVE